MPCRKRRNSCDKCSSIGARAWAPRCRADRRRLADTRLGPPGRANRPESRSVGCFDRIPAVAPRATRLLALVAGRPGGEAHEGHAQDSGDQEAHGGSLQGLGNGGQLVLLADARHQHEREREPGAGPEGEDDALDEAVAAVGLEERQPEDRAVGGDERQEDAQARNRAGLSFLIAISTNCTVLAMTTMKAISRR